MPQERCGPRRAAAKRKLSPLWRESGEWLLLSSVVLTEERGCRDKSPHWDWQLRVGADAVTSGHRPGGQTGLEVLPCSCTLQRAVSIPLERGTAPGCCTWACATSMLRNVPQRAGVGQEGRLHTPLNMGYLNRHTNGYSQVKFSCCCKSSCLSTGQSLVGHNVFSSRIQHWEVLVVPHSLKLVLPVKTLCSRKDFCTDTHWSEWSGTWRLLKLSHRNGSWWLV